MPDTLEQRFTKAFNDILLTHPTRPPTPTELSIAIGRTTNLHNLEGRLSKLRIRLMIEAGFVCEWPRGSVPRWKSLDQVKNISDIWSPDGPA